MLDNISVYNRSAITNGKRPHRRGKVDGRSHAARRWRDLYLALQAELGRKPTVAEDSLLRSAASLGMRSETLAADLAGGRTVDDAELNRTAFSLRRTLDALGLLDRPAADEGPTIEAFLAEHQAKS